jgi:hypothetical protein
MYGVLRENSLVCGFSSLSYRAAVALACIVILLFVDIRINY